jgi:hypothetical protein
METVVRREASCLFCVQRGVSCCRKAPTSYHGCKRFYIFVGGHLKLSVQGFQYNWFEVVKASDPALPVLLWMSACAVGCIHMFLPPKYGGVAAPDAPEFTEDERRVGRPKAITGELIQIADLPPMHDWEFFPQGLPQAGRTLDFHQNYVK